MGSWKGFASHVLAALFLIGLLITWSDVRQSIGEEMTERYAIAIHGGAGVNPAKLSPETSGAIEKSLQEILRYGQTRLAAGDRSLDVIESVIRKLEDDPLFNAGRGAVFNAEGKHELDASIMDGKSLQCGAVAGIRIVKNPISLARGVMEQTSHVLLAGDGAEAFAAELAKKNDAIVLVENQYFSTDERKEEWERKQRKARENEKGNDEDAQGARESKKGTVGCVVLDRYGNLAAGTSTGGLTNKKFGRVGDSPIIGAGTYANNQTCAISCTGAGEHFIRNAVAFHVSSLMAYRDLSLDAAVRKLMFEVLEDDTGGLIAIDRYGAIVMHTNTPGMSRAAADSSGRFEVKIARDP